MSKVTQVTQPPKWRRVRFLACLTVFWLANPGSFLYKPDHSFYAHQLGASYSNAALISVAPYLAPLLFCLPLGIYSDRIGRRKLFISIGFVAAAAAGIVLSLAPSPGWMFLALFVSGVASCSWVMFAVLFAST